MPNLCIIPARGGSKRIPRKNIKDFLGKPIIAYSILEAIKSSLFDEVMVSTDDKEISEIAIKYGAKVPYLRSSINSNDLATTADVIEEVLSYYAASGQCFEFACCIYPTAPFVRSENLNEGFLKLIQKKADSIFPIVQFEYPIWRGLRKNEKENVSMVWPENINERSQDLELVYHDAGQWYWLDTKSFLNSKQLFSSNSLGLELSPLQVQDIDNLHDWNIAELKYEYLQSIK
ncbi:pseudaminic acid cytidylyltransferase [Belliella sp. R4-6]|uniref:Pseudaminic acid cytidylyltransferase n=1 Tax=Belliella alkalica TaxID=1730871 RepID=A0ABS9V6L7_9BACT|nr:pseudaminic acid cytidylyltransferase [Belliella alkalica]MCH7412069.1 pseudaminic acid cytidylyltransferase [Belliella alkalica]